MPSGRFNNNVVSHDGYYSSLRMQDGERYLR
jgi:hypothetical protein